MELEETELALSALRVIPPSNQVEYRLGKSKFMRSGLPRLTLLDRVITFNYLPPHGQEPPRVEVSAPRADEVKDILRRWEPFHRGEFAADRLSNLYPHIYQMLVLARGMGLSEDHTMTILAGTRKDDILQIIDDEIQVWNSNFVQSTELVR